MSGKGSYKSRKILLAEDNDLNKKVTVLMLERLGFRTDTVANGLEVLKAMKCRSYDLVLLNLCMPLMDGLKTTRMIRRVCPETKQPRIVGITAYVFPNVIEMCIDAGMDDCIIKPVGLSELRKLLYAHLPKDS